MIYCRYFKQRQCNLLQLLLVLLSLMLHVMVYLNHSYKERGRWPNLQNKPQSTCVITGGSNGLGLAMVEQFLFQFPCMTVVIIDKCVPKLKHSNIVFYQCDLSDSDEVESVLDQIILNHGNVDVLVNNAGIRNKYQNFSNIRREDLSLIFKVNVVAPTIILQKLAPKDEARQFYLVTIASVLGINAPAKAATYAATKASLIALHESWSHEHSDENLVRSLLVLPGQLDTAMFQGFKPPKEFLAPLVDPEKLAVEIVNCCRSGVRGELCAPLYANFMYILKGSPYMLVQLARKFSGMDKCLPIE